MNLQRSYLADFVSLLFPELCAACHESLITNEHLICTKCRFDLPFTNFHLQADNIVARQFWVSCPWRLPMPYIILPKAVKFRI